MIYLDYAANSPVSKEVLDTFYDISYRYLGNPNSSHKLGIESKKLLDESTSEIALMLNVKPSEIIYTSGASESNNLAIKGIAKRYKNKGKHIITDSLEHSSIIAPLSALIEEGYEVDIVSIQENGQVDLEHLKELLRQDTILVSISYVDSEIGINQPIKEISEILKSYPNCFFHSDATQAVGKIEVDTNCVDLMTFAPHKFYGLNGFGVLIKKENVILYPLIHGGKSTTLYRSGTPVLASVVALKKALGIALLNLNKNYEYISSLNQYLRKELKKYKCVIINSPNDSIPHTLNISVKGVKASLFASELEKFDVFVSTKAACCPTNTMSKSVYAISNDKKIASSTLRISMSHLTTKNELDLFLKYFNLCYNNLVIKE